MLDQPILDPGARPVLDPGTQAVQHVGLCPRRVGQEPLIDLLPYGAMELGISRMHAMIRKTKNGYKITDLGSSNGTWLENQRLTAKKAYPLESGDRIRLGRLNILVFYANGS